MSIIQLLLTLLSLSPPLSLLSLSPSPSRYLSIPLSPFPLSLFYLPLTPYPLFLSLALSQLLKRRETLGLDPEEDEKVMRIIINQLPFNL